MSSKWTIKYAERALTQLKKLHKKQPHLVEKIMNYLDEVAMLDNPRNRGKGLVGGLSGMWCYRVGDYRVICHIDNGELLITALEIGHRREIYH